MLFAFAVFIAAFVLFGIGAHFLFHRGQKVFKEDSSLKESRAATEDEVYKKIILANPKLESLSKEQVYKVLDKKHQNIYFELTDNLDIWVDYLEDMVLDAIAYKTANYREALDSVISDDLLYIELVMARNPLDKDIQSNGKSITESLYNFKELLRNAKND